MPLSIRIHDGLQFLSDWKGSDDGTKTHIVQMVEDAYEAAKTFGDSFLLLDGFGYHFWTHAMPGLNHFSRKGASDPLSKNCDAKLRTAVLAVEGFIMFSCVAMGLLQMLPLRFSDSLNLLDFRYLRTRSSRVVSEGTTMCILRRNLFRLIALRPDLTISRIILSKSDTSALHRAA